MRRLEERDIPACEAILRGLPEWFGIEAAIVRYVEEPRSLRGLVALAEAAVVGFLTTREPFPASVEIEVLGVRKDRRRTGVGSALLRHLERDLVGRGVRLLQVKTLGPSHPDRDFDETRAFYLAQGFTPLEETTALWGADQPTLILVKPLTPN